MEERAMKSDRKKRILAAILCMVMVLSSNISALAEGEVYADPDAVTQMETPEAVSETQPESAPQEPAAEEPPVSTEQIAPEAPAENNEPAAPEAPAENNEPAAPETPAENSEPAAPEASAENNEPAVPETPAENNEPAAPETPAENNEPAAPETPEEEAPVFSEETELTKELRDASGKLVQKVTAKLPKGAFKAETSQIEMEVTYVDSSMENYIKGMMEEKLPTDNTLGDYFLYNIQFKVNGEAKESLEPITITFEKSNLEIKDTKKANVFFFDPANPEVSGDKDELVEIAQRSELLESLQAAGQSTATMEEDYDLSSIEIKEENRSGKIVLEGRKSTIYGCYVEKEPEQKEETPEEQPEEKPADIPVLNYEDDKVTVSVTAEEAGIIPEGAQLKVLPITSEDTETKEQYQEVEKKIQEKVAEEEKEVAGFLAYDITFVDKDGNEMEPNGKVKVSMNYKKAELPPEVEEKKATDAEVTVLHLEEDENGEVKQVVDMGAEQKANVDTLTTTEGAKVQNVEVETESFSVFTITWTIFDSLESELNIQLLDTDGNQITASIPEWNSTNTTKVSDIAKNASITGYTFQYAVYGRDIDSSSEIERATKVVEIKYEDWKWKYKAEDAKKWNNIDNNNKIYFIYKKDSSSGGSTGGGSSATGNLAHSKYVKDNGDGTYDLTLDVVGAVGTETNPAEVDIVFVLDLSGSMDDDEGRNNPRNLDKAKSAVQTLTTNLNADNTVDSQWKLVTFSSSAKVQTQNWVTATDINDTIQDFKYENCSGGTNYEAGLTLAGSVLKTARRNSTKIVIFLTDGKPTYHGIDPEGGGNVTWLADYNGAITGAKTINCDRFYSVGMGLESSLPIYEGGFFTNGNVLRYTTGLQLLTDVANATGSSAKQAINVGAGGNLDAVFSGIAGSITEYTASNVTITDKLTPEVDLVDELGEVTEKPENLTIKVLDKSKKDVTNEEVTDGNITPSYNPDTKQITLDFADNYKLKEGYTYSVTAKIKPNDQAKERYKENDYSYPDTGEEGTGSTSAGKKGIFSNVEDSAKVTWTTNGENKEGMYNRPVVQILDDEIPVPLKKEPVNFFLNLSSSILDMDGNISGQLAEAFTTSVSGSFSTSVSNQGIGVPINEDLRVVVPNDHDHGILTGNNKVYGVIGGTSGTNAKLVDEKIRKLGSGAGTNGNQSGTEDENYRIVNGSDQAAFPTDEEIFEYIKKHWSLNGVNKGQNITINGNPINKDNLTTENFAIRWYVFKDQPNEEYWHIDGILVPRSGVLTITKTFSNKEVAEELNASFKIKVTGNFLGDKPNTTIEKGLADAGNPTENNDGTVTYQWDFAVFGDSYTIEEIGYETSPNSKWKYKSTSWTYTDADGDVSEGKETSSHVQTKRTAEDAETPKTQTFALTNNYELANVSIDLKKFGKTYDNPLNGAKFELYRGSKTFLGFEWELEGELIEINNVDSTEELDLPEGYYKLKEVLAPTGYQLLGKDICFKIENRVVTLIDAAGNALESGNTEMWNLEGDNTNGFVLKIKNEALYELPSTGGTGIFVYTIGGTLLLMAAALLIYKMKREEVLKG